MVHHKWSSISKLHAFPRPQGDLTKSTLTGALLTIAGVTIMATLFINELLIFLSPEITHSMAVDATPGNSKLDIHMDVTFPGLPCQVLSLDALDMSGRHDVDIHNNIFKEYLDADGKPLSRSKISKATKHPPHNHSPESDFLASLGIVDPSQFEDTIAQVQTALAAKHGCRVHGHLSVQRVAGNFHISVHGQNMFVLNRLFGPQQRPVNVSHVVHSLTFGPSFPSLIRPLDNTRRLVLDSESRETQTGSFKYFIKVVPTNYVHASGGVTASNQYSVTEYFSPGNPDPGSFVLPGVFFMYDLSPIAVTIHERRRSFLHFLTQLCAVLGGTFALTGALDKFVYQVVNYISTNTQ